MNRVYYIALNTFREAVRDRVLYNLVAFAVLMCGTAILVGQISFGIEKLVVINLGLTAVSLFGVVISIFIGIGLVSKEIEKRTLYTLLSRPVCRWEFVVGKFVGLVGTLFVNTFFMAIGVMGAMLYVAHHFEKPDGWVLVAVYFIILQFVIVTALALLFSSFSIASDVGCIRIFFVYRGRVCGGSPGICWNDQRHYSLDRHRRSLFGTELFGTGCYYVGRP